MFRPVTPVSSTPVSTGTMKHQQSPVRRSDRLKSLFSKSHRVPSEESNYSRLMDEIRGVNRALEAIRSNQQCIEVTLISVVEL